MKQVTAVTSVTPEEVLQKKQRAEVIMELVREIATIPDALSRSLMIKEGSSKLRVDEQVLMVEVNRLKRKQFREEICNK